MGSDAYDLYEAIFDVDLDHDDDVFGPEDGETHERDALRSIASAENIRVRRIASLERPQSSINPIITSPTRRQPSPHASPRKRRPFTSAIDTSNAAEVPSLGTRSPLAKLFTMGTTVVPPSPAMPVDKDLLGADLYSASSQSTIVKMEQLLHEFQKLPAAKLTEEMKELQV
jgi:hypothetical protein